VANFCVTSHEVFSKAPCFHRIVPGFVIQGGGLTSDLPQRKPTSVRNEAGNGVRNPRGTLSMAAPMRSTVRPRSSSSIWRTTIFSINRPGQYG